MSNDYEQDVSSMAVESGTVALLNRSEIDMQVATAHKYPRSIKRFRDETLQMVTLNEVVAESCIYALPRGGKTIEGPSARFAEVIASAWGNCRAGARVVSEQGDFITAQGVFHDLERNVAITFEVQRRITDSKGKRYQADMIGVTGNAASSIALRNAILKGVPKAFWDDMYQAARKVVMGDVKTLANRRAEAIKAFVAFGVNQQQIIDKLEVAGVEDIGLEHLVILRGLLTAIREGDTTAEQAFSVSAKDVQKSVHPYPDDLFQKELPMWQKLIRTGKKTVDAILATANTKAPLTEAQIAIIKASPGPDAAVTVSFANVAESLRTAGDLATLDAHANMIRQVADEKQRSELTALYQELRAKVSE